MAIFQLDRTWISLHVVADLFVNIPISVSLNQTEECFLGLRHCVSGVCNLAGKCFLQVAAFRATLEEISGSSLLVHVVDIRFGIFISWLLWANQS